MAPPGPPGAPAITSSSALPTAAVSPSARPLPDGGPSVAGRTEVTSPRCSATWSPTAPCGCCAQRGARTSPRRRSSTPAGGTPDRSASGSLRRLGASLRRARRHEGGRLLPHPHGREVRDPRRPPPPEGVTLFGLFGSGEFLPWAEPVDTRLVESSSRRDGRVLVVPTASAPEGDAVFERWAAMGTEH